MPIQKTFDRSAYRAVALDLYGTLLSAGGLSPAAKLALEQISALGLEIVIATGIPLPMVPRAVLDLPFLRYAVTSDGARVSDLREPKRVIKNPSDEVNKATGLLALCGHLSLKPDQIIAFGDSGNDFEMLKLAGYSVAMGNAPGYVKEVANRIAPTATEDGVAKMLNELFGFE